MPENKLLSTLQNASDIGVPTTCHLDKLEAAGKALEWLKSVTDAELFEELRNVDGSICYALNPFNFEESVN